MGLFIGFPGRSLDEITEPEWHALTKRPESIGECSFVSLPAMPETPQELSAFLAEVIRQKCSLLLITKKTPTPEHICGVLRLNGVGILRVTNKLEILTRFVDGRGYFEFCRDREHLETFSRTHA